VTRKVPAVAIFLISGGVLGSAVVLTASVFVGFWLWNSDYMKSGPMPEPAKLDSTPHANGNATELPNLAPSAQLGTEVLKRVKQATVYLRVRFPNGSIGMGSGFFGVEPHIIITNAHVLGMLDPESRPPQKIEVVRNSGTSQESRIVPKLLGVDRVSDLAVLSSGAADDPPPLDVRSAQDLQETQQLYIVGFPLGEGLGKEITVSQSSVSSLRREHGMVTRVQVNGGMHPGNSGGPVVDTHGNVVGVAVSVLRYTQINFAVPGDYVHLVLNGRSAALDVGQPYLASGRTKVLVAVSMIDPLGHIEQTGVEVWTGLPSGSPRPSAASQPPVLPGDTPHQRQSLNYQSGLASADITLPRLAAGKVYWLQPTWVNARGDAQWGVANDYVLRPAVERRPIQLVSRHQQGSSTLHLESRLDLRLREQGGEERRFSAREDTHFSEKLDSTDSGGGAKVRLQYLDCSLDVRVNNQKVPLSQRSQRLMKDVKELAVELQVDRFGSIASHKSDTSRVPQASQRDLAQMHELVEQVLEVLTVPFPNKQVSPGDSWQAVVTMPVHIQGRRSETATAELTYTYLGTRKQNGRDEAVIGVRGPVAGRKGREKRLAGRTEGTAVVDLAAGKLRETEMLFHLDMDLQFERPVRAGGSLHMRLNRNLRPAGTLNVGLSPTMDGSP
jgi:S1-C subfamily serine protease